MGGASVTVSSVSGEGGSLVSSLPSGVVVAAPPVVSRASDRRPATFSFRGRLPWMSSLVLATAVGDGSSAVTLSAFGGHGEEVHCPAAEVGMEVTCRYTSRRQTSATRPISSPQCWVVWMAMTAQVMLFEECIKCVSCFCVQCMKIMYLCVSSCYGFCKPVVACMEQLVILVYE